VKADINIAKKMLIEEKYIDVITFAIGSISSGKTTFLTKFGWLVISIGELVIDSLIILNIFNPKKSAKAKSIKVSFFITPNLPPKIKPKTKKYKPNISKGEISDQIGPNLLPLCFISISRLINWNNKSLFLYIDSIEFKYFIV